MYDKVISRILRKIMQKFLSYLVVKLQELGATIIYASTQKLIIDTHKYQQLSAQSYTEFVLKTIVSYPLFAYLVLNPVKYWKVLLFKDNFNYSGIPEQEEFEIVSEWNIAEVLPPKIEEYFKALVAEYIHMFH